MEKYYCRLKAMTMWETAAAYQTWHSDTKNVPRIQNIYFMPFITCFFFILMIGWPCIIV